MEGPRAPRRGELAQVAQLHQAVFGVIRRPEPEQSPPPARLRAVRGKRVLIVAEEGRPVSRAAVYYDTASMFGCRVRTASISGVCTHPECRGRGYASRILERCLSDAVARRARVFIVSGDRGLYQRVGCRAVGAMRSMTLRAAQTWPAADRVSVRKAGLGDRPMVRALYDREPLRFCRCADGWAELEAEWQRGWPETWIVERRGVALAYLWLGPLWSPPRQGVREVYEYAGSRLALVEALPRLMAVMNLRELSLAFSALEEELSSLLAERGVRTEAATLPGTHRLLDLPGLMRDLTPYLAERLPKSIQCGLSFGQDRDRCCFCLGEERADLELGASVELVLGSPRAPVVGRQLGEVLAQVFPVPFPTPGMNMV